MSNHQPSIHRITSLIHRIRPNSPENTAAAERNIWCEIARLEKHKEDAAILKQDLQVLLSLPHQTAFYAETCIRSALGFWLELSKRIGQRILPKPSDDGQLTDILQQVFTEESDYLWVASVGNDLWMELAITLQLDQFVDDDSSVHLGMMNVMEAARALSYRIAGVALDRELMHAEPALEFYDSPFLAQNAMLIPILERARNGGENLLIEEFREIDVLLDQGSKVLERSRRKAGENGISVRLTYLLARLYQLMRRLRDLLEFMVAEDRLKHSITLMKTLTAAVQTGHLIQDFVGENVSLIARNITDHASRHGEHYIAEDRAAWWAMARSAAGGGFIIAIMAMLKLQLSLLHLPLLTEGIAFGLNYGIGFVLIHLLGFSVATKQPAMTASSIAATLEDAKPRDLERLGDLAQNVVSTQFVAVLGNVGIALPMACLIAFIWPLLFGSAVASPEKSLHLLAEMHPWESAALFFAAIAGVNRGNCRLYPRGRCRRARSICCSIR